MIVLGQFAADPAKEAMERGQMYETIGTVLAVVGILCVAGGIVWAILTEKKTPNTRTNWAGDGSD
jgi:hypothetical protein